MSSWIRAEPGQAERPGFRLSGIYRMGARCYEAMRDYNSVRGLQRRQAATLACGNCALKAMGNGHANASGASSEVVVCWR